MGKLSEDIAALSQQISQHASQPTDPITQHMNIMYQVLSRLAVSIERIEEKCATKDDLQNQLVSTNANVAANAKKVDELEKRVAKLEEEQSTILSGVNDEMDARIRKQRNLVIFGMPESNRSSGEGRKEQDLETTRDLFQDMKLKPNATESIRTLYRAGKKKNDDPNPRPLILSFFKPSKKHMVLQNAKNLKNQTKWKKVSVCDDKTKMQIHYEKLNDDNATKEAEEKNKELAPEEADQGFRWVAKGPRGRKRVRKQQLDVSMLFSEKTMNGTFVGFPQSQEVDG